MAQNVYDNASFFAEYNKLPRSQEGLAGAPEWPALREIVGTVKGSSVLDLGCGYGWFCRWTRENGADRVHGIDISQQMLEKAQRDWPADEQIKYEGADLDEVYLPSSQFDLVYSSLAFHYIRDIKCLFKKIFETLVPGGRLVFSIEHPLFTAPLNPNFDARTGNWTLNSYQHEGERVRDWLGTGVKKQHRTLTSYFEAFLEPGFRLEAFQEWKPTEEQLKEHPDWGGEMHRPVFLLLAASKGTV
jgi:SAM-dependent methyltransferase